MVEGVSDARAVRGAVRADVIVLGSSSCAGAELTTRRLWDLLDRRGGNASDVVVLLDPDVAGRQGRQAMDAALPGCRHAFVPAHCATTAVATRCDAVQTPC